MIIKLRGTGFPFGTMYWLPLFYDNSIGEWVGVMEWRGVNDQVEFSVNGPGYVGCYTSALASWPPFDADWHQGQYMVPESGALYEYDITGGTVTKIVESGSFNIRSVTCSPEVVNFGDILKSVSRIDYDGPAGYYTFAVEIGIWEPPIQKFCTYDRQEYRVWITTGGGIRVTLNFSVREEGEFTDPLADDLEPGKTYDTNLEIGNGSQEDGNWEMITRKVIGDAVKIGGAEDMFSSLSVTYTKA